MGWSRAEQSRPAAPAAAARWKGGSLAALQDARAKSQLNVTFVSVPAHCDDAADWPGEPPSASDAASGPTGGA